MNLRKMWLNINGVDRVFTCDPEVDTLSDILRRIGLTGTKVGCGTGVCGSCSVILNGELVRSCTRKVRAIKEYSTVITIEGIGTPQNPHPIQIAWMNCGAVQCGFCTPGFIVSTYALLMSNPNPTRQEAREWFTKHRNVCRCTGYKQIIDAVMAAAKVMRGEAAIEDISVKVPKDGEYYGKPLVRPTALAKVCGLYDYGDDLITKVVRHVYFPYNVPHVAALGRIANTNHNFATAYRSYGSPQAYTHSESMMDLMAEKLGLDPFEIRWRNIAREGDTTTASYDYLQYPAAVLGQAYGGISHSIGFALTENYDDVKIHGNIARSGVPYCTDTPDDINVILIDRPDEIGPFGSSGSSEAFQASGHMAVINGIKRACGVRVYELPASPDKIKAGMDAIAAGEAPIQPEKYFLGDDMYERLADIKEHPVKFGGDSFYEPLDDKNAAKPF